eukprot:3195478-Rhodomonas_salina.2
MARHRLMMRWDPLTPIFGETVTSSNVSNLFFSRPLSARYLNLFLANPDNRSPMQVRVMPATLPTKLL